MARAISTAPAVSLCTTSAPARIGTRVPSTATTSPSVTIATARPAASSGSVTRAPGSDRGTSRPSGVYPRSTKPSASTRSPASSASRHASVPGWQSNGIDASYSRTASTMAPACSAWVAATL